MRALASLVLLFLCYSPGWAGDTAYIDCTGLDAKVLTVYSLPSTRAGAVGEALCGAKVLVLSREKLWARIGSMTNADHQGYILKSSLSERKPSPPPCRMYVITMWRLESGEWGKAHWTDTQRQWWRKGRRKFKGLCFTNDLERADYVLAMQNTTYVTKYTDVEASYPAVWVTYGDNPRPP
ncbi:hypothetical protein LCGC14_1171950, partial [marine sediment metagenome]